MKLKETNPSEIKKFSDGSVIVTYEDRGSLARTLDPDCLGKHNGWNVEGSVQEDYYKWVNDFKATKGNWVVKGNFESEVTATNMEALEDFLKYNPVEEWDYLDI